MLEFPSMDEVCFEFSIELCQKLINICAVCPKSWLSKSSADSSGSTGLDGLHQSTIMSATFNLSQLAPKILPATHRNLSLRFDLISHAAIYSISVRNGLSGILGSSRQLLLQGRPRWNFIDFGLVFRLAKLPMFYLSKQRHSM